MSVLKVRKVGNSLGVIFPKDLHETLGVSEGDVIDVTPLGGNKVILGGPLEHHSRWVFQDSELTAEDSLWVESDLEDDDEAPQWRNSVC